MRDVFEGADVAVLPDRYGLGLRNSLAVALPAGGPVVAAPGAARPLTSADPQLAGSCSSASSGRATHGGVDVERLLSHPPP